jgi:hypothetical protein
MSAPRRTIFWENSLQRTRDRLGEPLTWYPYPAMISFGLVMVLVGQLIPGLNPRRGSRADVIELSAPRSNDGMIWIGVFSENDRIVVTTSDRKRFSWPVAHTLEDLLPFSNYLRSRVRKESRAAGLANHTTFDRTSVVISVDQRLKYIHISPILIVLAQNGVAKYGFETRSTRSEPKRKHG